VSDHDDMSIMTHKVLQILVQKILAYNQNLTLKTHTAVVMHIDEIILQLSVIAILYIYLKELYQDRFLSKNLQISCSELYDLQEHDQQKKTLKLIINLFKFLNTQKSI